MKCGGGFRASPRSLHSAAAIHIKDGILRRSDVSGHRRDAGTIDGSHGPGYRDTTQGDTKTGQSRTREKELAHCSDLLHAAAVSQGRQREGQEHGCENGEVNETAHFRTPEVYRTTLRHRHYNKPLLEHH